MTTVHTSPDYSLQVKHPSPADYPTESIADRFEEQPFTTSYQARRQALLDHCLHNPAPQHTKGAIYEIARLAAGGTPHPGVLLAALDYIDQRRDCADFVMHNILRLVYQFSVHPKLDPDILEQARQTILEFKYWPDEPGLDSLCTWTENHQILFASAAYLAGQRYPDQVFSNSGQTGSEKMSLNRPRILRWLALRFQTGFSEWLSHVYYDEDLTALLSLVDFCNDAQIVQRAKIVLDTLLLDMALNTFKGVFGSTHGRSYENSKKWASNEGTTDTSKLLFGTGIYSAFDNMSAVNFALSENYQMPEVLYEIANDLQRPEMVNRQRMGIRIDQAERWGLSFDNHEDGMRFLSLEAYLHPRTANLVLDMFDAFNWWENRFFSALKPYQGLVNTLRKIGAMPLLARGVEYDACRNTREQVDIYTYRTPDYMLSCAQDYRPGYGGDQQHVWQATLGPDAVCFTTHPVEKGPGTPDYWAGSGTLPRAAQVKNVVIVVYKITKRLALYVPNRMFFTHAWLPRDRFDEVLECDGWIFARLGSGYLALRSQQPYRWQDAPGEDQGREIIADGARNIWLCELGRADTDGAFEDFTREILRADLEFRNLAVKYRSPSQGLLEFGWKGPLRQDGEPVNLHEYPRYDSPYVQAEFPPQVIEVQKGGQKLTLGWETAIRETTSSIK